MRKVSFDEIMMWVCVAFVVFGIFGLTMSIRQSSAWADQRRECVARGGVPWQAKNSGGPICLNRESLIMENQ